MRALAVEAAAAGTGRAHVGRGGGQRALGGSGRSRAVREELSPESNEPRASRVDTQHLIKGVRTGWRQCQTPQNKGCYPGQEGWRYGRKKVIVEEALVYPNTQHRGWSLG